MEIEFRLPAPQKGDGPLRIRELRTYLPDFAQHVNNLPNAYFDEIRLTSDHRQIVAEVSPLQAKKHEHAVTFASQNLQGDSIRLETTKGPITGTYNATVFRSRTSSSGSATGQA